MTPSVGHDRTMGTVGAFAGMGNERGWEMWTGSAARHFAAAGAETRHELYCPKATFGVAIADHFHSYYYHLCHGGSYSYLAGDSASISSHEVAQWVQGRPPLTFTFIGSCGGMEETGPGTLCHAFSRGDPRQAVVGYVHMGEQGSGWCVSLPWQDVLFSLMIDHRIPIYEALLRAQTEYPQMSRNWGFWGNREFVFPVKEDTMQEREGARAMWRRAKGGELRLSSADLEERGGRVLAGRCAAVLPELFLKRSAIVTEEDTGAKRCLLQYGRRHKGIPVLEDYVSVELDPADGELIGFHVALCDDLPDPAGHVRITPEQALDAARESAEALLREHRVVYDPGSVRLDEPPGLAYTSKLPFISPKRILAYVVPIQFSRSLKTVDMEGTLRLVRIDTRQTRSSILIDPASGSIIALVPPPPG